MPKPRKKSKAAPPFYKRHWGTTEARNRTRLLHHLEKLRMERPKFWWQERRWFQKALILLVCAVMLWAGGMYGIAQWYIYSHRNQPIELGTTFIPSYAQSFGLDPKDTFNALLNDLGMRNFRLVGYWSEIEATPGTYDSSQLDWQFQMANSVGAKISLAVGLRQPRWPECHVPSWAAKEPTSVWQPQLKTFIGAVVNRYKHNPALESYQLENEYFLKAFGLCTNFDRSRLVDEFKYVKQQDPHHPVIISRSNNAVGLPLGQPTPDEFGVSIYKRVWDKTITHRYYEYPFPAWFYGFLAGAGKIATGKDMVVHELQSEPWLPTGFSLTTASIAEQNKSMSADILKRRIKYGEATGMKSIDLWGSEWWYYRKVHNNDPALWNVVKQAVREQQNPGIYK